MVLEKMDINLREKTIDGRKTISGEAVYLDVKFTFSVHRASAKKADYSHVLKVNIIDPRTGKILQKKMSMKMQSEKIKKVEERIVALETHESASDDNSELMRLRRKKEKLQQGERLDECNASISKYLVDDKKKTVKKAVEIAVKKLYGKHCSEICKALRTSAPINDIHLLSAFEMYQNGFFSREPAVAKKTLKDKKNALRNICERLNEKPLSKITVEDIAKVAKSMKGNVKAKLNCAEKFLTFCGELGAYAGANPITVYKESHHDKKTGGGSGYPEVPGIILLEEEQRLHEEMEKDLFSDLGLAVPLGKGARMSIPRMLELYWKDFIIDSDGVRIQDYKDQFTGATNNYIRPPTKEVSDLIVKKYGVLVKKYGKTRLRKMKVLIFPEGTTEQQKKAAVTKHIYEVLRNAEITREKIRTAVDHNNPQKAGGAGLSLLHKHYDYALKEYGGVDLHSGIGLFLRGMRIYDTTTDSYRCLNDETGNYYLQVIMRRIDVCTGNISIDQSPITSKVKNPRLREIKVAAIGHDIRTGVQTKKVIRIPKGTTIVVKSKYGVKGSVKFRLVESKSIEEQGRYQNIY